LEKSNNIIGKIAFVRARASNPGPAWITDFTTDPTWFYKQGAGPVFDLAVYPLQLITRFLGPAKRVFAFSGKSDELIDRNHLTRAFSNSR